MILGNLYREKGQVGKAITIHQTLLQRQKLGRIEHAYVLLCLGLDYKRGGFVDRALDAFSEVLRLDPQNEYALDQHPEAARGAAPVDRGVRHAAAPHQPGGDRLPPAEPGNPCVSRERNRSRSGPTERLSRGRAPLSVGDRPRRPGRSRIPEPRRRAAGARPGERGGRDLEHPGADRSGSRVPGLRSARGTGSARGRARAIHESLQTAYRREPAGLARPACAVAPPGRGRGQTSDALELLFAALVQNPHSLRIHQAIWRTLGQLGHPSALVDRYGDLTGTPSSTSTRTCACAAATAAPSCSGSVRTATTGTPSSRNGSRRRRTPRAEREELLHFCPRRGCVRRQCRRAEAVRGMTRSTCASVSSNVPSVRIT